MPNHSLQKNDEGKKTLLTTVERTSQMSGEEMMMMLHYSLADARFVHTVDGAKFDADRLLELPRDGLVGADKRLASSTPWGINWRKEKKTDTQRQTHKHMHVHSLVSMMHYVDKPPSE